MTVVVELPTNRPLNAPTLLEVQYQTNVGTGKKTDLQHLEQRRNAGAGGGSALAVLENVANLPMQEYRDQHRPIRLEPDVPNRTLDMSDPSTEVLQADATKNRSLSVLTLVRRR